MRTKSVRRAEVHRPAAGVSNSTLADPNEAIKVAVERALPVLAGLFSDIVKAELGAARAAAEPPLMPCDACGLGARDVKRLVDRGELAAVKVRRRWYAAPDALRSLLPARALPAAVGPEPANDDAVAEDRADRILREALAGTGLTLASPPKNTTGARRAGRA